MLAWVNILSGLVKLFSWLARWVEEAKVRADERRRIELEARRDRDKAKAEAEAIHAEVDDLGSNDLDERLREWLRDGGKDDPRG